MSLAKPKPIREYDHVDRALLDHEIRPPLEPAVLRGAAAKWPAVRAAGQSDETLVEYVKRFSAGRRVAAIVGQVIACNGGSTRTRA